MKIAISIVSHGQSRLVEPLLAQLRELSTRVDLDVIVTENLPGDPIHVASNSRFRVRKICNPEPKGFGANHNAAFALCETEWFVVMNPDLRLTETGLTALMTCLKERPGVAGPRVVTKEGRIEDSARRVPGVLRLASRWYRRRFEPEYNPSVALQGVDWLAGMCLAFDRRTFEEVGGFDDRFHLYCEDVDICLRVHLLGGSVTWVQSSVVVHDAQRTSHRKWRYLLWHVSSLGKLLTSRPYWQYRLLPSTR
ncbi:glycosyltransferase [Cupriavidus sp. WGtm5]|uniref:glycosyltransferase n=1 Tax=Cupriavidus sp. WGtm5 TaxID=2919926 RepID=UPI002090361D|nr:glycosyltransferase [Cupriavidus sp. WGtm5]MCO4888763.1 glycosyltransferase [Cupriavidus sp. WGtm5]